MRSSAIPVFLILLTTCILQGCHSASSSYDPGSGSLHSGGSAGVTLTNVYSQLPAFNKPVLALQPPVSNPAWYIVEQTGHVRRFTDISSVLAASEVVDISDRVDSTSSG